MEAQRGSIMFSSGTRGSMLADEITLPSLANHKSKFPNTHTLYRLGLHMHCPVSAVSQCRRRKRMRTTTELGDLGKGTKAVLFRNAMSNCQLSERKRDVRWLSRFGHVRHG
ncbi:hypothetical protein GE21DRAFT_1614 [Neurospora crassa]|uniref:Uncharacterized protein n=1 Tax=Neurospora crassa (strain ATCC 24698 / 74-OR23-1A / CBS 708.71 / DSM 1257 / FGSC 987) TaxID=367110 RepID=Q7S1L8_NEUCR|nr:hypothetical protein NCU07396 [Neurospora crassa OR74A]EAA29244.2 hypothetical protein NCU07396 [Neurospora crassa OR74A]KHE82634.1 hypothetical protein GE21DRAFT_1614 [Neurospora crassa]|eukprot:XP_958480.2 hypothetical protein NCU07396 [Neurospora crassa OR74A]